jgi:RNA polymerase sigma-70 factor (ECF subfamily)
MPSNFKELSEDKELIHEIKGGNKEAFKTLFYRYYQKLVDFGIYKLKDIDSSKDLVQDLFIRVWNLRNNLDPQKSIKAYLYKSLLNQLKNHYKKNSKNISLKDYAVPHDNYEQDAKIDYLTAIEDLPEKMKIVIILSRIEGFKYSEIAEICDISIKAVEKRISKALKLLRIRLSK